MNERPKWYLDASAVAIQIIALISVVFRLNLGDGNAALEETLTFWIVTGKQKTLAYTLQRNTRML